MQMLGKYPLVRMCAVACVFSLAALPFSRQCGLGLVHAGEGEGSLPGSGFNELFSFFIQLKLSDSVP